MCLTHLKIHISQHHYLFMAKVKRMDKYMAGADCMRHHSV